MSTHPYALSDSATMLRRNLRHMLRYPSVSLVVVAIPVIFLLLFVYVFGGTLGAGLGVASGGPRRVRRLRDPGDHPDRDGGCRPRAPRSRSRWTWHEGIIARFRTMGIARASVLAGHVLGSTIQTMAGLAVVIGVALLVGFRARRRRDRMGRGGRRAR